MTSQSVVRGLLIFVLAISSAFLPCSFAQEEVPSREVDPEVARILKEVSEHLRGLKSFRVEFVSTMKMNAQGMNMNMVTRHSIAMERPNKFAMIHKEGMMGGTVVSDGETLYSYMPMMGTYTVGEAPKDINEILSDSTAAMAMGSPGVMMFFPFLMGLDTDESPLSQIDRAEYLGVEEVDGVRCHHLKLSGEKEIDLEMWVTADGPPVVTQIVPDMSKAFEEMADATRGSPFGENMNIEISTALKDWEFNIDLPDDVFTFAPPPQAKKADSFFPAASPARKPSTLLGKAAPPFTLELLDGGRVNLLDHKGKDIVILDFWATWCGPCRSAMPLVDEAAREYADRDVVLYAVNLREGRDLIEKYLADTGLKLRVALDTDGAVGDLYDAHSIPQTVIIGKNGTVQTVLVGFSPNLKEALSRNLDLLLAGVELAASPGGIQDVPALSQALKDENLRVRDSAATALRKIDLEPLVAGADLPTSPGGAGAKEQTFQKLLTLDVINAEVAFSPDGKTVATASGAGELKLWDAATGAEKATMTGHLGSIAGLAFSPDGKGVATGSVDKTAKLWDVETGEERYTLRGHSSWVITVAFSPDGKTLATGSGGDPGYTGNNEIKLWDTATGQERATLKFKEFVRNDVYSLAFAPDGKTLASGSAGNNTGAPIVAYESAVGRLTLWDAATGEEKRNFFEGQRGAAILSVAFSPDGQTLAWGDWLGVVRLGDAATGQVRATLKGHTNILAHQGLAFSPDGRFLVSGSGSSRVPSRPGEVKFWDTATGKELATLPGDGKAVKSLMLSPDGKRLAVGSINGNVKIWTIESTENLLRIAKAKSVAPGPAPPGKVWSTEHGHWHDVNPRGLSGLSLSALSSTPTAPTAPDFVVDTIDGNAIRLADYEGKVLLLDFWDSWSGPFITEGSVAADELEGLRSERLEIVGVNLDLKVKELRGFLEDNAWITWPQVADLEDSGEPNDNHVSLRYDGQLVGVNGRLPVNLNNHRWHHARIEFDRGQVEVYLTPHGARESRILSHEIENWHAYAGQFNFGARTGGSHDEHFIDNFIAATATLSEKKLGEKPSVLKVLDTGLDFEINVDFDDGLPAGARLYEAAEVVDGAIRLTPNVGNSLGGLSFPEQNDGRPVTAWSAEFDFRMGGGTGADGFSITFSRSGDVWPEGEEGPESGVAIGFDTFRNYPGLAQRFGIGGQPQTVLIDKGGAILRRGLRGKPLAQALRAALRDQLRPQASPLATSPYGQKTWPTLSSPSG